MNEEKKHTDAVQGTTRRQFIIRSALAGIGITFAPLLFETTADAKQPGETEPVDVERNDVDLIVNGRKYTLTIDSRLTLLDALREKIRLTGTKKGCDHGQCGACTVLVNGRRINSCLMLAAMCQGDEIITIEGLANGEELHPMQAAFMKHDAFQCGYCTPGQICSAVGLIKEGTATTDAEIREQMSGNICRCGAYENIIEAIKELQNA